LLNRVISIIKLEVVLWVYGFSLSLGRQCEGFQGISVKSKFDKTKLCMMIREKFSYDICLRVLKFLINEYEFDVIKII
jgi:hypothetical protein